MSDQNKAVDSLNMNEFDSPKLPTGLNVLTILTFIGCLIQLYSSISGYANAEKSYAEKDKVIAQINSPESPAFVKGMMPSAENMETLITKSYENKLPLMLLGLVAAGLCFFGALQMRKLKKQGFLLYAIGQLLPFLTSILFIGAAAYSGTIMIVVSAISLLFLLLYFMQRKHLVY
ncbi:MAG: hypothetical protein EOO06_18675 [Chitinophagaceae bacterium]|nr:MAG: hypothetical protein EOO06_18675 [Chitinophagaceae bacterium]